MGIVAIPPKVVKAMNEAEFSWEDELEYYYKRIFVNGKHVLTITFEPLILDKGDFAFAIYFSNQKLAMRQKIKVDIQG